jgi:hypothetical protein
MIVFGWEGFGWKVWPFKSIGQVQDDQISAPVTLPKILV